MHKPNFCVECGDRLGRSGWRARFGGRLCRPCAQRLGAFTAFRSLIVAGLVIAAAFALGRYLRPAPPPLIIERAANSEISDAPVDVTRVTNSRNANSLRGTNENAASISNDEVYICGARTKKGTPCQRRVHAAGERCFQHKGMAAMVPLEKLIIKTK